MTMKQMYRDLRDAYYLTRTITMHTNGLPPQWMDVFSWVLWFGCYPLLMWFVTWYGTLPVWVPVVGHIIVFAIATLGAHMGGILGERGDHE